MKPAAVVFVLALSLVALAGCSSGSSGGDAASSAMPVVDGLACSSCPAPVNCTSYQNQGGAQSITVPQQWQDRFDLCCPLRLCEVDGACLYGCPDGLLDSRCR